MTGPSAGAMNTADVAGLVRSEVTAAGIRRQRCGRGFRYFAADGTALTDREALARIEALVIPPAWEDVWISPLPLGHIQAVGTDAAGRRQYRYHDLWREQRDREKRRRCTSGDELLAYRSARRWHDVSAADINDYLRKVSGGDFSAKDFSGRRMCERPLNGYGREHGCQWPERQRDLRRFGRASGFRASGFRASGFRASGFRASGLQLRGP